MNKRTVHGGSSGIRASLIYDSSCPICSRTIRWIEKNGLEDAFEMVPCPGEDEPTRSPPVDRTACLQAMQLVLPDGRTLAGEKAFPEIFMRLKRYHRAAALFRIPGAFALSGALYRWFAGRRYSIARIFGIGSNIKHDHR